MFPVVRATTFHMIFAKELIKKIIQNVMEVARGMTQIFSTAMHKLSL